MLAGSAVHVLHEICNFVLIHYEMEHFLEWPLVISLFFTMSYPFWFSQHSDRRLFDALLSDHTNLKVSATKKAMLALTENADSHSEHHHHDHRSDHAPVPLSEEDQLAPPPDHSRHRPHASRWNQWISGIGFCIFMRSLECQRGSVMRELKVVHCAVNIWKVLSGCNLRWYVLGQKRRILTLICVISMNKYQTAHGVRRKEQKIAQKLSIYTNMLQSPPPIGATITRIINRPIHQSTQRGNFLFKPHLYNTQLTS